MKTFNDLIFTKHSNGMDGCVQAKLILDNNITLSVVGGAYGLYGDGKETFEVGAWHNDSKDWIKLSEHDDVVGWQSKDDIDQIIQKLMGI
jgi:hypothetical protein